jgi:hypothetical protein
MIRRVVISLRKLFLHGSSKGASRMSVVEAAVNLYPGMRFCDVLLSTQIYQSQLH